MEKTLVHVRQSLNMVPSHDFSPFSGSVLFHETAGATNIQFHQQ